MKIRNEQFELGISPATGRVIAYGPVGGPNVLWQNPGAPETPVVFPGWVNWGGDKVWIWPEEDWAQWNPETRHPPGDPSPVPHQLEGDGLRLRMTSPLLPHYGLRIVRDIALAPTGSRVTFSNRLEQAGPGRLALPVGLWTVTQIPAAPQIFARLSQDAAPPGYESFPGTSWPKIERSDTLVTLHRPSSPWQKVGLDANLLAVPVAGHLFIVGTPAPPCGPQARFRRAQVFFPIPTIRLSGFPACRRTSSWSSLRRSSSWRSASRYRSRSLGNYLASPSVEPARLKSSRPTPIRRGRRGNESQPPYRK